MKKLDRKLTRSIIGKKRDRGWGIEWSEDIAEELHTPILVKFVKICVFASGTDAIWTAVPVDIQSFAKSNKGYTYTLIIIDVFS